MASRYHPTKYSEDPTKYSIPKGFPETLKAFVREVLRHQPEDIDQFGVDYFTDVIDRGAADDMAAEASGFKRLSPDEL